MVETSDESSLGTSKTQITHREGQVTSIDDIEPGVVYRKMFRDHAGRPIVFLEKPNPGDRWASVRPEPDTGIPSDTRRISLADVGIIPYEGNSWNANNYLARES